MSGSAITWMPEGPLTLATVKRSLDFFQHHHASNLSFLIFREQDRLTQVRWLLLRQ